MNRGRPQKIESLKAFLPNDKEILDIINLCELKPSINTWKEWIDIGENILYITENRKLKTKINKIKINENCKVVDIYIKCKISKLLEKSIYIFIILSKNNIYDIFLLAKNLYYFKYKNNKLNICLPLSAGLKKLRKLIKYKKTKHIKIVNGTGRIIKYYAIKCPININEIQDDFLKEIITKIKDDSIYDQ